MPSWWFNKQAPSTGATPPADYTMLFVSDGSEGTIADGLYKKTSDGTVTAIEGGAGGTSYTDERAQDAVGSILTDTSTIDATYSDSTPSITFDVKDASVTNVKAAGMAAHTIKGNNTGSTAAPLDLTLAQVKTELGIGGTITGTNTGDQTITLTGDVTGTGTGSFAATIAADAVDNTKAANMVQSTLKGRAAAAGTGDPTDLTPTQAKTLLAIANTDVSGLGTLSTQSGTFTGTSSGTNTGDQTITLTGDVTGSGTGSFAATVATSAVTNAKLANAAANTIKGNITGSPAAPVDMTVSQAMTLLGAAFLAEAVEVFATAGSAVTLSAATTATMHRVLLSTTTCAITAPAPVAGHSHWVEITQDGTGGRAITWVGTIQWPDGAAPMITVVASKRTVVVLSCADATVGWIGGVAPGAYS